jgi:hypothetical protein
MCTLKSMKERRKGEIRAHSPHRAGRGFVDTLMHTFFSGVNFKRWQM